MDTPLSYASPMLTEKLIIERGIASVSSAPESLGGHISANTARGEFGSGEFGMAGLAGTRFSTNGNISTSAARLTFANDRNRLSLIGELDDGDDIRTPEGLIRPSRLNRERYDVSYAYRSDDTRLLVFAGRLDTENTGTAALPMDIRGIETDLFGIQFATAITAGAEIEAMVSQNDVYHSMDNFSLRPVLSPMMARQNSARGSGTTYKLSARFDREDSNLRVGVDGVLAEHDSVITNPNMSLFQVDNFAEVQRDLIGVFAEWRRKGDASNMEVGLRYKQVETDAGEVGATGMMGANADNLADTFNAANRDPDWDSFDGVFKFRHALSKNTEWSLELGSKTRAPSYQELFLWLPLQATGGLADGRTYIGNLNLRAERSNEIVIGMSTVAGRVALSPQIFFRQIDDYIQGVPSTNMIANMVSTMMAGAPPLQFENVDAEIWGLDVAWRVDLTDRLLLDGVASLAKGRRTDLDDNLYRLAPLNGSIGLTYGANSWSMKSELVAYAKQDKVSAFNSEQATPGYGLVNFGFAWDVLSSLRVEARIENVLDKGYQDHLTGINRARGSDIPLGTRLYGAERTSRVGLIYRF